MDCPWAKGYGSWLPQYGRAVAVDDVGAVFVAGMFEGSMDLGGGPLHATEPQGWDPYDGFVAKLTPTGAHEWSLRIGDSGADSVEAVALDGAGRLALAGFFTGTVDVSGQLVTSEGYEDALVAVLDSSGAHVWSRNVGGPGHQHGRDVAVDSAGNFVVAGHFDSTIDIGTDQIVSAGSQDAFVAKLTPEGGALWIRRFGGSGHDVAGRLAVDSSDSVLVAGRFEGTVDFGGGSLLSMGGHDAFAIKLDSSGGHLWSRGFGGAGEDEILDVSIDSVDAAILTGRTNDALDFGAGSLCGFGQHDAFLAKLDAGGGHLWSQCFGGLDEDMGAGVTITSADDIVITGAASGMLSFGGGAVQCLPGADVLVARFDTTGNHLASACYGGATNQYASGVALDPWGSVLLVGSFRGSLDFGSSQLDACGFDVPQQAQGSDMFVAKLVP